MRRTGDVPVFLLVGSQVSLIDAKHAEITFNCARGGPFLQPFARAK